MPKQEIYVEYSEVSGDLGAVAPQDGIIILPEPYEWFMPIVEAPTGQLPALSVKPVATTEG
ncbi:hypothetical protein HY468_03820 [Candidatus Roizmanbacteria bacterium]|nr:hypothetical protein [Candidatus Roizmanbacteria bacterium]